MELKREDLHFIDIQKFCKSKVQQKDFRFYRWSKNVENEGKAERFLIVLMLKNAEK